MIIRSVEVTSVYELTQFSNLIAKGVIQMPNISRLARELSANRRTVRNALQGKIPSTSRRCTSYLDAYRERIIELLSDAFRSFEYYQHLYNYMIREEGITCSYSTFKRYIQKDDTLQSFFISNEQKTKFTERFETKVGQQAQFDLKEKITVIDRKGKESKVNVATLTFGFSRYNVRKLVPDTSYETVVSFLAEAFDDVGGVPKELVIDNIKCLVDKPRSKDKDAILNVKFVEFAKDYNITIRPCMPYRPETKGKTETQNKVPGQIKNYNGTYKDVGDIHTVLKTINDEDNDKISQATGFPASFLLKKEKEEIQALPSKIIRSKYYLNLSEVIVSRESLVSYKSCKYSVPKEYIAKKIGRRIRNDKLLLYYNSKIITIHQISDKKMNINPAHNLRYEKAIEVECHTDDTTLEEMENIQYDNC